MSVNHQAYLVFQAKQTERSFSNGNDRSTVKTSIERMCLKKMTLILLRKQQQRPIAFLKVINLSKTVFYIHCNDD